MLNIQLRRTLSLMVLASFVLGVFTLAGTGAQAAPTLDNTATVTASPADSATPADTDTPAASTPAATDTPPVGTPAATISATASITTSEPLSPSATGQAQNSVWSAPVNLSQSGAASGPAVAADANGNLHVLWWDKFEGTKYAYYTAGQGWSKPATVATIIGARTTSINPTPGAPAQLRLLVDNSHELFAFWIDAKGNLLFAQSRAGSANSWTTGLQLATAPLAWDVAVDSAGALHLAYVRPGNNELLPAGIYYRQSTNGGLDWGSAVPINQSPYFRTLDPAAAHVNVASNGTGVVFVTWDDPQLRRSFFALSQAGGKGFADPVRMEAADALQSDSVQRARVFALSTGQFLRLWQAGDNCVLYQQQSDDKAAKWSAPVRVLQNLGGCPTDFRAMAMPENQLFATIRLPKSPVGLVITEWDGQTWAPPQSPRISFVNSVTNQSTGLACLEPTLLGVQIALIGCDDNQDVWAAISLNDVTQVLPALNTAWSPPAIISTSGGDADLPAVAAEADARMHVLWSQTSTNAGPAGELDYARGDGVNWTAPVVVLASPHGGQADAPAILADGAGSLHAVWSGGFAGEVYYSHSFIRDAATSSGWSSPKILPAPAQAGNSPAMVYDTSGTIHVLYGIPLNEARGVYYTRSEDQGATWLTATEIFDAAAAGWPMVTETHLVVDSQKRLHATWVEGSLPPATTSLGIFYSRSEDGGQTWSPPVQISGVDTGFPVLAASGPSELHLLWSANLSGATQLWHQWSTDGGASWSKGTPLIGVNGIAPRTDLATDGAGNLYMVGIERTADDSAALFYLHWDGNVWTDRETLPLGYTADSASGARAIILPDGRLSVFYRIRAPTGNGGGHYVLGYAERPVTVSLATPEPSITPQPTLTLAPTVTPQATLTTVPTPDLNPTTASPVSRNDMLRIGAILIGMFVVVIVAFVGLRLGQR